MDHLSPSVNLLKNKDNNYVDKFIAWALTIGRMVIILTETIALVAFLYRFILDRQIIDQKDSIDQKAALVKLYEPSEKKFRNLQDRLKLISQLQDQSITVTTLLKDIISIAPQGILFNTITLTSDSIHLDTNVKSVAALTTFVNKIKQNPEIVSVSIDKIENKTLSATIAVGITAKLKPSAINKKLPTSLNK